MDKYADQHPRQQKSCYLTHLVMTSITLIFSKQVGLSPALNCIATAMRCDELRIGVLNRIIEWNCIHHAIHSSYN
jgi:hypothetical protein